VNRPKVLLLDEPLGALDLKLRQQMQTELKQLQREVGITFVFVTHDQEEALVMSDRIAVFNEGRIEQVGTSSEVYEHPASPFVSTFVGTANVLSGSVAIALLGREGTFSLRPEKVLIDQVPPGDGIHTARGRVTNVEYLGPLTRFTVAVSDGYPLAVLEQNDSDKFTDVMARQGKEVTVAWHDSAVQAM
jgi:putative spermidine/putrescine transport system ATP-binding protein